MLNAVFHSMYYSLKIKVLIRYSIKYMGIIRYSVGSSLATLFVVDTYSSVKYDVVQV